MIAWGEKERSKAIENLSDQKIDLLIIGGGITGAGILLDAASRGIKAVLLEKDDFASGTSSRSTKLIHGGLRYLKQLEVKIVRETGQERAIAYKNAPHLVLPEKMILPIQEGGTYGKFMTSVALKAYDWLAGVEKQDRRKMLSKEQTLKEEPLLKPDLLKGSGFYSEYRTDDSRLTMEVIKTALSYGGTAISYAQVTSLKYNSDGKISGVNWNDITSGLEHELKASVVVNAAGPWSDEIRSMDGSLKKKRLHLTKGVHIVFDHHRLPLTHSVYFDVSGGRMIFAIPRGNRNGKVTYVGTTDTNYNGQKDNPGVTLDDVNYLLDAANNMFPAVNLTLSDVKSSWSGLRPLIHEDGKSPSELSRKDEIFLSDTGLITIAGGKLTGYRVMAKKVTDEVSKGIGNLKKCTTDSIKIHGFPDKDLKKQLITRLGKDTEDPLINYFVHNYGSDSLEILKSLDIESEVKYCIDNEMCLYPYDFFVRRTGMMYFDIDAVREFKNKVGQIFADHFEWKEERLKTEMKRVEDEIISRSTFT
ncbi:MAG: glycerol-3-phosphate dehydrogenase/oxidase [Flavobacteriales bacterium]|nr:glycerol-3-phosphate dehydrogenase/oxidase [Flavobacteriales bacterium]MCB9197225.1 glycerol-3-phosphate dehydrogenase/oxidase [Flavobacteriales bacterium]